MLMENQLRGEIPAELGLLRDLEELYLGDNQIAEFPSEAARARFFRRIVVDMRVLDIRAPRH